jgi:glyoxylase I family protein
VTGFFHVGLCVSSVERSREFYSSVVGMTLVREGRLSSDAFDALTDNVGSRIRFAYLRLGAFILQLVEYEAGGGVAVPVAHNNVGSPHLSFFVDDVDAVYRKVSAIAGVERRSVVDLNSQMRTFYVFDPDGCPVELMQVTGDLAGLTDSGA